MTSATNIEEVIKSGDIKRFTAMLDSGLEMKDEYMVDATYIKDEKKMMGMLELLKSRGCAWIRDMSLYNDGVHAPRVVSWMLEVGYPHSGSEYYAFMEAHEIPWIEVIFEKGVPFDKWNGNVFCDNFGYGDARTWDWLYNHGCPLDLEKTMDIMIEEENLEAVAWLQSKKEVSIC